MKKNSNTILEAFYIFLFSLCTASLYAQEFDPGFPIGNDPGEPAPETPIDGWVPFMLIVGLGLVFYYQYKKKKLHS
jgi:hypothetical protein